MPKCLDAHERASLLKFVEETQHVIVSTGLFVVGGFGVRLQSVVLCLRHSAKQQERCDDLKTLHNQITLLADPDELREKYANRRRRLNPQLGHNESPTTTSTYAPRVSPTLSGSLQTTKRSACIH